MTDRPTVSIVIPAYNEEATIRSCVEAAFAQTEPADEVMVVDNRSTDGTARILEELRHQFPLVVFEQRDEQGLVPTRDFGLDRAMGEVLGRIDADTVLEPNWVAQVRDTFTNPGVAAATGPMIYYDMPLRRFGHRADDAMRRAILAIARDYHFVFGSNMAIRASAWRDIRGSVCRDEADEYHEDIDLSIHLFERGHRVVYEPKMTAGMSARRLDDNPREFYSYVWRYQRTYDGHGIDDPRLRAPMVVWSALYPALKGMRWQQLRRAASS